MAIFNRRRTTDEVLEAALSRVLDAQSKQIESVGSLLGSLSELSMKRAAQALGSRGGRKRAQNVVAARARREVIECRLCRNPGITNPTAQEIVTHAQHEIAEDAAPPPNATIQ